MSSIESTNQSLNNILEKIGVKSPQSSATTRKSSLGQEDFLKLMTTQLQNQDPMTQIGKKESTFTRKEDLPAGLSLNIHMTSAKKLNRLKESNQY